MSILIPYFTIFLTSSLGYYTYYTYKDLNKASSININTSSSYDLKISEIEQVQFENKIDTSEGLINNNYDVYRQVLKDIQSKPKLKKTEPIYKEAINIPQDPMEKMVYELSKKMKNRRDSMKEDNENF